MSNREALLRLIEKKEWKKPFILAIDGRCASGKTTLAGELRALLECNVVHMDDFYLPFEKRTKERMAQFGGNIDFERLYSEVLFPLKSGIDAEYRPYDCHANKFMPTLELDGNSCTIVEGSYSCHPKLRVLYDLCVFVDISSERQQERLMTRNPATFESFQKIWIPREESYFTACHVREHCDLIICGD